MFPKQVKEGAGQPHGDPLPDRIVQDQVTGSAVQRPLSSPNSAVAELRSEEHTSELQSLMRISYAVFCLKKKKINNEKKMEKTDHKTTKNKLISDKQTPRDEHTHSKQN